MARGVSGYVFEEESFGVFREESADWSDWEVGSLEQTINDNFNSAGMLVKEVIGSLLSRCKLEVV